MSLTALDVNYQRLMSKAIVSQTRKDLDEAARIKKRELFAYGRSDVVIAISDQDKALLAREDANLNIEVLPLIFPVAALQPARDGSQCNLLFVGNFEHAANADAILFFCDSVFRELKQRIPCVKLTIIGNAPSPAVKNLAGSDIDVLGFVPELQRHYADSDISIAPLTWGGGLKGKIAEAMAFGLPVVATSVGIDGFGLSPNENVVCADTPEEFVEGIVNLHRNRQFYEDVRTKAWEFVEQNYGEKAVRTRLEAILSRLEICTPQRMPRWQRLTRKTASFLDAHLLWRFRR